MSHRFDTYLAVGGEVHSIQDVNPHTRFVLVGAAVIDCTDSALMRAGTAGAFGQQHRSVYNACMRSPLGLGECMQTKSPKVPAELPAEVLIRHNVRACFEIQL